MQFILIEHKKLLLKTKSSDHQNFLLQTGNNVIREYNKTQTQITQDLQRCKSKPEGSVTIPSCNLPRANKDRTPWYIKP